MLSLTVIPETYRRSTPAFLVPLTRHDWPTAAVIDLSRLRSLDPGAVAGSAGQLTHATLGSLSMAVRAYLGAAEV